MRVKCKQEQYLTFSLRLCIYWLRLAIGIDIDGTIITGMRPLWRDLPHLAPVISSRVSPIFIIFTLTRGALLQFIRDKYFILVPVILQPPVDNRLV
jgi:hypothetical protein